MEQFPLAVKQKGRTVLPAGLQRACGFAPGAQLVARPLGPGRFIVESADAVLERIWSRLPTGTNADEVVEELGRWRLETEAARQGRLENPQLPSAEEAEHRAADLLSQLGL